MDDSSVKQKLNQIPQEKAIAALIGQATADNFAKQGPGWPPLQAKTIRGSLSKKLKKEVGEMSDKDFICYEHSVYCSSEREYNEGSENCEECEQKGEWRHMEEVE